MTVGRTPLRKHRTLVASSPQTRTEIAFRESILKHGGNNIELQRSVNSRRRVFDGRNDGQNANNPVANSGGRWLP